MPCRHHGIPVALLGLVLLFSQAASAHLLNMSKARISLLPEGQLEVRLALDLLVTAGSREEYYALSQLDAPLNEPQVIAMAERLAHAVELELGGTRIPLKVIDLQFPKAPREQFLDPLAWPRTNVTLRGTLDGEADLPSDSGLRVRYAPGFRFEEPIANTIEDTVTGRSQTRWLVTEQQSPLCDASFWVGPTAEAPPDPVPDWGGIVDFLRAGFTHIIPSGLDHLLFVAGLCLGAAHLRELIGIVTLFTVAHSITLAAMALGFFSLPSSIIEPIILLSILWVAMANLRSHQRHRARIPIVLLFGLTHGLGFAGALRDIGLPEEQELWSLLAFNAGVEVGQLSFVCALLLAIALLRLCRSTSPRQPLLPFTLGERRWGSGLIALITLGLLLEQQQELIRSTVTRLFF